MKIFFNALTIVVLAALASAGVLYADKNSPKKQTEVQQQIDAAISKYVENNSLSILEHMAKNEEFANAVKNFSGFSEQEIAQLVQKSLENNPKIFEEIIRKNRDLVVSIVTDSDEFKDLIHPTNTSETNQNEQASSDENNIFKVHWKEIIDNDIAPSVGPKDAKVVVAEFFDFACGHCKSLAPIMSQLMKSNPDVRFIYNPLYFISEHSPYAAKVALVAAQKGKFVEIFDGIMTLPNINEDTINQILVDEGLNVEEVKKLIEEKSIRRGIQDIDSLSQVLGINGVPMIIINGEPFYGRSLNDLQNKINSLK